MKTCKDCNARIETESHFCPLCGAPLESGFAPEYTLPHNQYPNLYSTMVHYNFMRRLCLFFSLFAGLISIPINLLTSPQPLWCLIVIASIVYCWFTIPPLLRKGKNFASKVVVQVFFTSALVILLDFVIGYNAWSVNYALPGLFTAGTLSIGLMIVFNRTNWAQYVLSQVIMGVFGFVPLVLYLVGISSNLFLVLVCAGLSLGTLLATFVFADRSIKSEFKRRFHS